MQQVQGDKIWYEDVGVLARRWTEFFPTADQTPEERVNALVRLVLYATAGAFAYNREVRTLVMGVGVVAVVSFAFGGGGKERFPAGQAADALPRCQRPTKDNPFANALLTDLSKPRAPACPYDEVRGDITKYFNDGLFRNATDVYERENSQRQFYTMPVTTGLPDTAAFADFLYGGMKSCKTDQSLCPSRR